MSRKDRRERIRRRNQEQMDTYSKGNSQMSLVEAIAAKNAATVANIPASAATPVPPLQGKTGIHKNSNSNYIVDDYAGYKGNGYKFKQCDHYPRRVIDLGDLTLYGATKSKLDYESMQGKDLILNVSGNAVVGGLASTGNMVRGGAEFDALKSMIKPIRELILEWADGGIFPVGLDFWRKLYDICLENKYRHIVATCLGGHGRTGTALASLIIANTNLDAETVTKQIHAVYCEEAIETFSQSEYLSMLAVERDLAEVKREYTFNWSLTRFEINKRVAAKSLELAKAKAAVNGAVTASPAEEATATIVPKCFCRHSVYIHSQLDPANPGQCLYVGCGCTGYGNDGQLHQIVLNMNGEVTDKQISAEDAYSAGVASAKQQETTADCYCTTNFVCRHCSAELPDDTDYEWNTHAQCWEPVLVCKGCISPNCADCCEQPNDKVSDLPSEVNRTVVEQLKKWTGYKS